MKFSSFHSCSYRGNILMKALVTLLVLSSIARESKAQLSVDGDFRTRSEYRHGFQNQLKEGQDAGFFTSQRSRINLGLRDERYTVRFSLQDVRTWGSQPQTVTSDALLSVHEAWVEYYLNTKWAVKGGRMELAYDNHRILGNLDWAQQGRKHDLALLKFTDSTFAAHAGFAFNQDKEQSVTTLYTVPNSYKAMQFVWLNKQFKHLSLSFLFLNNGTQNTTTDQAGVVIGYNTRYSQTTGLQAEFKKSKFFLAAFGYVQTGKDIRNREVKASDLSAEAGYKFFPKTTLTAGFEFLSGTDQNATDNINRSFNPFYGTNHAFNGYMDYFYVGGTHINSVGVNDLYVKLRQSVGKGFVSLDVHQFNAPATIINAETQTSMDANMGTEVDLTIRQPLTKELTLQAGYSQMFATTSMEVLRGGDKSRNANWAYLWLIFKPDFLKKKDNK